MGGAQTPTGRPSTPGKPGKPCKEPCQSPQSKQAPANPKQLCLPPRDAPRCSGVVASTGYLQGGTGRPPKALWTLYRGEGGERDMNAPTAAGGDWRGTTGPPLPPSQHPPTTTPLTGFPSGPASPLSPGRPWGRRRQWGQCQVGPRVSIRRGDSAVLTGAPSLPFSPGSPRSPRGPPSPCSRGRHRVTGQTGTFLSPPQGLLTPEEGCPQQCPCLGLFSMGLPHWQWETYDRRPYLLWVPARPQLPARPGSVRREMPSAPAAPPRGHLPSHRPQSHPSWSHCRSPRSLLASHAPSLPWVQQGHARPGGPSGCPPPRLPAGRAQSGPAPRGPQEGPPGAQPPRQAPMPRDWAWPPIPRGVGWHP